MEEIWKDVQGFEGRYQVSNLGRVRSLGFTWLTYNYKTHGYVECKREGKVLKPNIKKSGYLQVCLKISSKNHCMSLHRLVADTFIPNPDNLPTVNHKDEDKANNFVFINNDGSVDLEKSNLEWCTHKYNCNYGTRLERVMANNINLRKRAVEQVDADGNIINTFESISEACAYTGISGMDISSLLSGKRKTAHGLSFRYKDTMHPTKMKTGKYKSPFASHVNALKKQVCQYDSDGNLITTYESISEASKATGINTWQISAVCNNYRKIAHGFAFKFKE